MSTRKTSSNIWVTINQPGSTEAAADLWSSASGGALSFEFAENVVTGYSTSVTGRYRYEPAVLTASVLPDGAQQWLKDLMQGTEAKRDVLVELRDNAGLVMRSTRYRDAAIVAYQGPQFDGASRDLMYETIEFVFASAEQVVA
jgi:hypothetical protein